MDNSALTGLRDAKRFRERMEMAYRDAGRIGCRVNGGGPQTWFARFAGIHKSAVSRALSGETDIYGYMWAALDHAEEIIKLRERALKAEQNTSVVLLEDAAREAREEADRLESVIDRLRDLCHCPGNHHDQVEDVR